MCGGANDGKGRPVHQHMCSGLCQGAVNSGCRGMHIREQSPPRTRPSVGGDGVTDTVRSTAARDKALVYDSRASIHVEGVALL